MIKNSDRNTCQTTLYEGCTMYCRTKKNQI